MAATLQELRDRLEAIDALLASGLTSTSTDGESSAFSLDSMREERRQLRERLGLQKRRRRVFNFNMSGR